MDAETASSASVTRQAIVRCSRNGAHSELISPDGRTVLDELDHAGICIPYLHGDRVRWDTEAERWVLALRAVHPPLVGTLELASKTTYGISSHGNFLQMFVPFRKEQPNFIVACGEKDRRQNRLAVVRWDHMMVNAPCGTLTRTLGICGDWAAEREALKVHACPWAFPKTLEIPKEPTETFAGRIPLPELTFHIDPAGCKDVDDVLSLEVRPDGEWWIWITIADVDAWAPVGSPLDLVAAQRSQTQQSLKGQAIKPMLPPQLSEDACSLISDGKRVRGGVSLCLVWKDGVVQREFWALTACKVKHSFTQEDFAERCVGCGISWSLITDVASALLGRRTTDSHEIVEAFMLTQNRKAAEVVRQAGTGVLRKHGEADATLREQLQAIGGDSADLLALAEKGAEYCSANDPSPKHWGLSSELQCHATSPIRRQSDLVNQRILKAKIREISPPPALGFCEISQMNERAKILKTVARDEFFLEILEKTGGKGQISAICLEKIAKNSESQNSQNENQTIQKYKLWVPAWKRVVSWKSSADAKIGQTISLQFLSVPTARRWKDRILFRLIEE